MPKNSKGSNMKAKSTKSKKSKIKANRDQQEAQRGERSTINISTVSSLLSTITITILTQKITTRVTPEIVPNIGRLKPFIKLSDAEISRNTYLYAVGVNREGEIWALKSQIRTTSWYEIYANAETGAGSIKLNIKDAKYLSKSDMLVVHTSQNQLKYQILKQWKGKYLFVYPSKSSPTDFGVIPDYSEKDANLLLTVPRDGSDDRIVVVFSRGMYFMKYLGSESQIFHFEEKNRFFRIGEKEQSSDILNGIVLKSHYEYYYVVTRTSPRDPSKLILSSILAKFSGYNLTSLDSVELLDDESDGALRSNLHIENHPMPKIANLRQSYSIPKKLFLFVVAKSYGIQELKQGKFGKFIAKVTGRVTDIPYKLKAYKNSVYFFVLISSRIYGKPHQTWPSDLNSVRNYLRIASHITDTEIDKIGDLGKIQDIHDVHAEQYPFDSTLLINYHDRRLIVSPRWHKSQTIIDFGDIFNFGCKDTKEYIHPQAKTCTPYAPLWNRFTQQLTEVTTYNICKKLQSLSGECYECLENSPSHSFTLNRMTTLTGQIIGFECKYHNNDQCVPPAYQNPTTVLGECYDCTRIRGCQTCSNTAVECIGCKTGYLYHFEGKNCLGCGNLIPKCLECDYSPVDYSIRCLRCLEGHWSDGYKKCEPCPDLNCLNCDDMTGRCSECSFGFGLGADGVCRFSGCGKNQFLKSEQKRICEDCNAYLGNTYCSRCDYLTGVCQECLQPFTLEEGSNFCRLYCEKGEYWGGRNDNQCISCSFGDTNCVTCSDLNGTCTSCLEGYSLNGDKLCQKECQEGEYWLGQELNICVRCLDVNFGCLECADGTGFCRKCQEGMVLSGFVCKRMCAGEREYRLGEGCGTCGEGCLRCRDGTGECLECVEKHRVALDGLSCVQMSEDVLWQAPRSVGGDGDQGASEGSNQSDSGGKSGSGAGSGGDLTGGSEGGPEGGDGSGVSGGGSWELIKAYFDRSDFSVRLVTNKKVIFRGGDDTAQRLQNSSLKGERGSSLGVILISDSSAAGVELSKVENLSPKSTGGHYCTKLFLKFTGVDELTRAAIIINQVSAPPKSQQLPSKNQETTENQGIKNETIFPITVEKVSYDKQETTEIISLVAKILQIVQQLSTAAMIFVSAPVAMTLIQQTQLLQMTAMMDLRHPRASQKFQSESKTHLLSITGLNPFMEEYETSGCLALPTSLYSLQTDCKCLNSQGSLLLVIFLPFFVKFLAILGNFFFSKNDQNKKKKKGGDKKNKGSEGGVGIGRSGIKHQNPAGASKTGEKGKKSGQLSWLHRAVLKVNEVVSMRFLVYLALSAQIDLLGGAFITLKYAQTSKNEKSNSGVQNSKITAWVILLAYLTLTAFLLYISISDYLSKSKKSKKEPKSETIQKSTIFVDIKPNRKFSTLILPLLAISNTLTPIIAILIPKFVGTAILLSFAIHLITLLTLLALRPFRSILVNLAAITTTASHLLTLLFSLRLSGQETLSLTENELDYSYGYPMAGIWSACIVISFSISGLVAYRQIRRFLKQRMEAKQKKTEIPQEHSRMWKSGLGGGKGAGERVGLAGRLYRSPHQRRIGNRDLGSQLAGFKEEGTRLGSAGESVFAKAKGKGDVWRGSGLTK